MDLPIPKVPSTFYNIKQLLSTETVNNGIPVHVSSVGCLSLPNAALEHEDSSQFWQMKSVMDDSTRAHRVKKSVMTSSMHFFAQVAQTCAKKIIR